MWVVHLGGLLLGLVVFRITPQLLRFLHGGYWLQSCILLLKVQVNIAYPAPRPMDHSLTPIVWKCIPPPPPLLPSTSPLLGPTLDSSESTYATIWALFSITKHLPSTPNASTLVAQLARPSDWHSELRPKFKSWLDSFFCFFPIQPVPWTGQSDQLFPSSGSC